MKVYTKTGDKGMTSLIGGERVFKCDERVEAYGSVDELSAFVALLTDRLRPDAELAPHVEELNRILSRLMTIEALLAAGEGGATRGRRWPRSVWRGSKGASTRCRPRCRRSTSSRFRADTKPCRCATSAARSAAGPNGRRCGPTSATASMPRRLCG